MPKQLQSIRIKQGVVRLWNMIEIFLYFMWVEGWVDISSTKQPNDWMWFNLVVSTNTNNFFIRRPVRLPKALYVVHFHCDSFYTTLSKSCCQYCFFCQSQMGCIDALVAVSLCRESPVLCLNPWVAIRVPAKSDLSYYDILPLGGNVSWYWLMAAARCGYNYLWVRADM